MNCPSCGSPTAPGQKFCAECGAALAAVCPGCGHPNPPDNKFCPECGTALTTGASRAAALEPDVVPAAPAAAPASVGRRFITILFADLVGFTPFSEVRDAEEVRELLTTYFDRSRGIIERYAGEVDKFIGDAVMAVWGAVDAHEDDAERAVRAALELVSMVAELGAEIGAPELQLRAGVLSGETSVGPGGNEKGLVVGDLVNTASRLQSIAAPGSVFVGEATHDLVQHVVEFEHAGTHDVKGKEHPVVAYRALRVIAGHGGRRRADTLEPPYVGRDEELRLLKDQLHAVGRERRGRLVSIIGEAGIGKSRLAWELFKYIDGLPEITYWHQGRSPSYGEGLAFWALGEMVRRRAGIAEVDDGPKSRMKLRTALVEYVSEEEERRWLEPWLAGLLGIDPLPSGDRAELFAALRTLFLRVAERGQTVLVFEDLHWADDGLLDFITELVERSGRHPILVVTLSRPDLLDRHPSWGAGRRQSTSVRLSPLADADMAHLVTGMTPGIPDEAVAAIVARAAGIPLYAVEFVRMLVGTGDVVRDGDRFLLTGDLAGLAVPDSLQAVIGARIDRLEATDRRLVEDAAVLGQSFTLDGLRVLAGGTPDELATRLRDLVRAEIFEVEDDPRSPERGQYRFVQSVIREVAYGRVARGDRHDRHLQVAAYFEELDDPELVGALASHLIAARDAGPAEHADDLVERALAALEQAAVRAASLHSYRQVLALCEQALAIATDDIDRIRFWLIAAPSADSVAEAERSIEYGRRALAAARESGDRQLLVRAAAAHAAVLAGGFHADTAVEVLEPVYAEIEEITTRDELYLVSQMARAYMLAQDFDQSVAVADRALQAAERMEDERIVLDVIITRGTALSNGGRPTEATLLLRGAADLADRLDLPAAAIRALNNLAVVQASTDPAAATETWEQLAERTRRLGDTRWWYQAVQVGSASLTRNGRYEEALAMLAETEYDDLPEMWQKIFEWRAASIEMQRHRSPEVVGRIREIIAYWDDATDPQLRALIDLGAALLELWAGEFAEAYRQAEAVSSIDIVALDAAYAMGISAALLGDTRMAHGARDALSAAGQVGSYAAAIRSLLEGVVAGLAGRIEEAADAFDGAIGVMDRVGLEDDRFIARALYATVVGTDHPPAAAAADTAAEWAAMTGSTLLAEVFHAALPAGDTRRAGAG